MHEPEARLHARPRPPARHGPNGLQVLPVEGERDSHLYVSPPVSDRSARPLMVLLHGAGGHTRHGLGLLKPLVDRHGVILLAPASSTYTWDVVVDRYGEDVRRIDQCLGYVFARYGVDARRLAIAGFSDGASYALSLGLSNGDLFTHVAAFSPGFAAPAAARGSPAVFISHGTGDPVLPVDPCSRRLVPSLRSRGYDVHYREFEGGHEVPPGIAAAAVEWFLGTPGAGASRSG